MSANIKVNGKHYALPDDSNLKLREVAIIETYCGGNMAGGQYPISKMMGLVHVAIKRAEPSVPDDEIREAVENLNLSDLPDDPGGQSPPANGTPSSPETSETAGSPGSDKPPAPTPLGSGPTSSDTPPASVPVT